MMEYKHILTKYMCCHSCWDQFYQSFKLFEKNFEFKILKVFIFNMIVIICNINAKELCDCNVLIT